jgi:hypothetical protein
MCIELILFIFRYGADAYVDRVAVGDVLYSEENDTDEFVCLSNTEEAVHCFCFEIVVYSISFEYYVAQVTWFYIYILNDTK